MRVTDILLAALSCAATASAQAVPEGIAPDEPSPEGCEQTVDGNFTINIAVPVSRHRRESATEAAGTALGCTLEDGVLKDPYGRIGSIVANYQFQFDGPPQAGAIYTGGFSVCQNDSLAIGGSARWFRCMSGEFGNLYDRSIGDQCAEVRIVASMIDEPEPSSSKSTAAPPSTQESTQESSEKATSSDKATTSTWSLESASTTASVTPVDSRNATVSTSTPTGTGSQSVSVTGTPSATNADQAPPAGSTGGAVPTRVPGRETFGAVIGILGAALVF